MTTVCRSVRLQTGSEHSFRSIPTTCRPGRSLKTAGGVTLNIYVPVSAFRSLSQAQCIITGTNSNACVRLASLNATYYTELPTSKFAQKHPEFEVGSLQISTRRGEYLLMLIRLRLLLLLLYRQVTVYFMPPNL